MFPDFIEFNTRNGRILLNRSMICSVSKYTEYNKLILYIYMQRDVEANPYEFADEASMELVFNLIKNGLPRIENP